MNGALSGPLMLGSSPSDVWAGCHHFDGASFTPYALSPSVVPGAEFAVAGPQSYWVSSRATRAGATTLYVGRFTLGGADEDHSAEFDGASATAAPNIVTNGAEAYAVESLATSSRLYRLEGNRFVRTSAALPANARLKFVAGADDVFVTTEAGLMHWDGAALADAGVANTVYFTASIDGALWAVTPFAMPSRDPIEVRLRRGTTWETQTIAPGEDPARYPLTLTALSGGRLGIVYAEARADGSLATFTRTWDGAALSASAPLRDLSRECGDRCVMNRPSNLGTLADGTLMFSAYVGPSRYAAVFFPRSVFEP